MPNHVTNEIIFNGITENQRSAILSAALNAEGDVDFSILLPIPINAWMGNVGERHTKAFRLTALDWCAQEWGTKWNAYDQKAPVIAGSDLTLVFNTAWRPPYGWLAALFNTVKIGFDHNWLDEGAIRGVAGRFSTNSDRRPLEEIGWTECDAGDDLQAHLMALAWGEAAAAEIEAERAAISRANGADQ